MQGAGGRFFRCHSADRGFGGLTSAAPGDQRFSPQDCARGLCRCRRPSDLRFRLWPRHGRSANSTNRLCQEAGQRVSSIWKGAVPPSGHSIPQRHRGGTKVLFHLQHHPTSPVGPVASEASFTIRNVGRSPAAAQICCGQDGPLDPDG